MSDIDTAVVDGLKRLTLNGRLEKRTSSPHFRMPALPPKRTSLKTVIMSAKCHERTWERTSLIVRFVPSPDIAGSFDHLVRGGEPCVRDVQPQCLGGFEIDVKDHLGRLFDRQVGRMGALKDAVDIACGAAHTW